MKTKRVKSLLKEFYVVISLLLSIVGAFVVFGYKKDTNIAEAVEIVTEEQIEANTDVYSEAEKIDRYLDIKGSPMYGIGSSCVAAAEEYQIPCDLMIGIAGAESTLGTKGYATTSNNPFGLGVHLGWEYENFGSSFFALAKTLRLYYFDEGRTDVWSIRPKYCPRGIDNNGYGNEWEERVLWYMNDLANFV